MRITITLLIIFNFLLVSCNSNQPQTEESSKSDVVQEKPKVNLEEITESANLEINTDSIKFKGISLYTSKKVILKALGKPDKITEPKYECGPFSEAWQEMKFFQYFYGEMNFIVDEKEEATIQDISLEGDYSIEVNGVLLDKTLNFEDVISQLSIKQNENYDKNIIYLTPNSDDQYLLIFKNGKLEKFDRVESC